MIKTSLVRKVFFQSAENIKDQINALAYTFPHSHNVVFAGYTQTGKQRFDLNFLDFCRYKTFGECFRLFRESRRDC